MENQRKQESDRSKRRAVELYESLLDLQNRTDELRDLAGVGISTDEEMYKLGDDMHALAAKIRECCHALSGLKEDINKPGIASTYHMEKLKHATKLVHSLWVAIAESTLSDYRELRKQLEAKKHKLEKLEAEADKVFADLERTPLEGALD